MEPTVVINAAEESASIRLRRKSGEFVWAVVDADDWALLAGWTWWEARRKDTSYAAATPLRVNGVRGPNVLMHRLILNPPTGAHVDHIDGNGLNNRRSNIRICSALENRRHEIVRRPHTSPYKGVSWKTSSSAWTVRLNDGIKHRMLGIYDDPIEAAVVYDAEARRVFGEFAHTNFSEEFADAYPRRGRRLKRGAVPLGHGRGRYSNYGCRCDICRAAESDYQLRRRLKAKGLV